MIRGLLPLSPSDTMIAATEGTPLRRIGEQNLKKLAVRHASERPCGGSTSYKVGFAWIGFEPN
jgi:hypothetical protein